MLDGGAHGIAHGVALGGPHGLSVRHPDRKPVAVAHGRHQGANGGNRNYRRADQGADVGRRDDQGTDGGDRVHAEPVAVASGRDEGPDKPDDAPNV